MKLDKEMEKQLVEMLKNGEIKLNFGDIGNFGDFDNETFFHDHFNFKSSTGEERHCTLGVSDNGTNMEKLSLANLHVWVGSEYDSETLTPKGEGNYEDVDLGELAGLTMDYIGPIHEEGSSFHDGAIVCANPKDLLKRLNLISEKAKSSVMDR